MDRQLIDYLPPVLKEVKEIKAATAAEQSEIEKLWGNINSMLYGQFIHTAEGTALKRWERLVGITTKLTETVENRRMAVLLKWNHKPPFTVRYIENLLWLVVGSDYVLSVRNDLYELDVAIYNKDTSILRATLDNLKSLIPANIVLLFAGAFDSQHVIVTDVAVELNLLSDFYPRHNIPPLYNDGYARMDGAYFMNGLQSGWNIEFYPVVMYCGSSIKLVHDSMTGIAVLTDAVHKRVWHGTGMRLVSGAGSNARYNNELAIASYTLAEALTSGLLNLINGAGMPVEAEYGMQSKAETAINVLHDRRLEMSGYAAHSVFLEPWLGLPGCYIIQGESTSRLYAGSRAGIHMLYAGRTAARTDVAAEIQSSSRNEVKGSFEVSTDTRDIMKLSSSAGDGTIAGSGATYKSSAGIGLKPLSYESGLTIEKALGYNDGACFMDGSRMMDADIYGFVL